MAPKTGMQMDIDRMASYKALATAFSYPGPLLSDLWPEWGGQEQDLVAEYDRLFRAAGLWLYGAEHLAENEFQRARMLADIMGFYRAFGIEPDRDRPDALACELEFMHCLIFKRVRIGSGATSDAKGEKVGVCWGAERTFFAEHLGPAVAQFVPKLQAQATHQFYRQAAQDLLTFAEAEQIYLGTGEIKWEILPERQEMQWEGCS